MSEEKTVKNKIGFNFLPWSAYLSEEMFARADRLKEIGYDGVECPMAESDDSIYKKFGAHAKSIDMEVNCVLALDGEHNPISESAEVRAKALDHIKWAIDRTHDMNGSIICGPFHSAFAVFTQKPPQEEEYKRSAEVLFKAGEYAAQANITLALEAINRFECYLCNTMEQVTALATRVDHPNVQVMYDTHHSNIEDPKIGAAIKKSAPFLKHVHISENDRGTPGSGHNPWKKTFKTLAKINYQGWFTIEAFTRNDPEFANAINVWREYAKPWAMAEDGYAFIKKMCLKYGL